MVRFGSLERAGGDWPIRHRSAGEPGLMKTVFVGGLKRLPIRFDLSPQLADNRN